MKLRKIAVVLFSLLPVGCKPVQNKAGLSEAIVAEDGGLTLYWTVGEENSKDEILCRAKCPRSASVEMSIEQFRAACKDTPRSIAAAALKDDSILSDVLFAARGRGERNYTENEEVVKSLRRVFGDQTDEKANSTVFVNLDQVRPKDDPRCGAVEPSFVGQSRSSGNYESFESFSEIDLNKYKKSYSRYQTTKEESARDLIKEVLYDSFQISVVRSEDIVINVLRPVPGAYLVTFDAPVVSESKIVFGEARIDIIKKDTHVGIYWQAFFDFEPESNYEFLVSGDDITPQEKTEQLLKEYGPPRYGPPKILLFNRRRDLLVAVVHQYDNLKNQKDGVGPVDYSSRPAAKKGSWWFGRGYGGGNGGGC